ncbi:hypothetical protein HHK36_006313 [Tetracentron sinense]|uniref:Uncharacterized protein n=1 Tax=Tetracentron sinense TaxID=13715 RepID=A0A834ZIN8_TETSI|nr:hypothetical protein HHK36_006313 [Tetracentron sinense]
MSCVRSHAFFGFFLLSTVIFLSSTFFPFSHAVPQFHYLQKTPIPEEYYDGVMSRGTRRSVVEGFVENSSLILAAKRTYRRDPFDGFKHYTGGWNISEKHYLSFSFSPPHPTPVIIYVLMQSVAFTAAPLFIIGVIWFVGFGLYLLSICLYHCCCQRRRLLSGYPRTAYALSLVFLTLFTIAAINGCIVLYIGQGKFHSSTTNTLGYVVKEAFNTVGNLRNVSDYLAAAKRVEVDQVFLPSDVQTSIDQIQTKINASASTLADRTEKNSQHIQNILDTVRLFLIIIAAVMLILTFLGFLFSVLGMHILVDILVVTGWILVAGTFVLCGVFLFLHKFSCVVADTCVAMDQWVQHPTAYTALDDILPCVDNATAQETLLRTKDVTFQLVSVVNHIITTVSNINFPSNVPLLYYNQSGPLMPALCNPFHPNTTDRECAAGEVDLNNATQVWRNYVCQVSAAGMCTTVGRVTPALYNQMNAAVNVSYALYHYGPFLVGLEDCTFVRQTFGDISRDQCPGLRRYSKWIYIGLVMVSPAVMLSLIFWVLYARERQQQRVYTRHFNERSAQGSLDGSKGP